MREDDKQEDLITVNFYMKSGNIIVADNVVNGVKVSNRGDEIVSIEGWRQVQPRNLLMLKTLNLSQIEAITIS